MTIDRHRAADTSTYVFKTDDYGRTWRSIGAGIPKSVFAYARVIREDPRRRGMLYLGTENSLYMTLDDGATWMPLQGNLPHAPIAWLTVQEDFDDLVVATWGRGIWILDHIAPLRQLTAAVTSAPAHLFEPRPAYLFTLRIPTTSESFAAEFDPPSHAGRDAPHGAAITYHLGAPASGEVRVTILDGKGVAVRTLAGTRLTGLNRLWWDLRTDVVPKPTTGPGGAQRRALPPFVAAGMYTVKLSVDGTELTTPLEVRPEPK